jgi:dihydrofolate reductase
MRKLIVFNLISADGYFETMDHGLEWHNVDAEFNDTLAIPQLNEVDTLVFGRRTYELMASYWPTEEGMKDDSVVAGKMNSLKKLVFSRTLKHSDWNNTTVMDDIEGLRKLRSGSGSDMIIMGSSNLCVSLLKENLIDEIRLLVNPIILGKGSPIFAGLDEPLRMQLQSTRTFKSGNILLAYSPIRL